MIEGMGALAGIGGIVGGIFGKKAAKKAQRAREAGFNEAKGMITDYGGRANKQLSDWYSEVDSDFSPYQLAGLAGLSGLSDPERQRNFGVEDFQEDPGYQFALEQGQRGIENSAAAGGRLISGSALKALNRFNQGQANQQYQNSFNRFNQNRDYGTKLYGALSDMGLNSTNALGRYGGAAATGISQNYMNTGQNLAGLRTGQGLSQSDYHIAKAKQFGDIIGGVTGSLGSFAGGFGGFGGGGGGTGIGNMNSASLNPLNGSSATTIPSGWG